jgi:hypothetical protein
LHLPWEIAQAFYPDKGVAVPAKLARDLFLQRGVPIEHAHAKITAVHQIVAKNEAFYDTTFMELPAGLHGRQQFA